MSELIPYFELSSPAIIENCKRHIDWAVANTDDVVCVRVSNKREKRTLAQNRLYWMWLGDLAKQKGETADYYHHIFKYYFLMSIYYRDDPSFAAMCDAIAALKNSGSDKYKPIAAQVIRITSTTVADTKQMTEYLSRIFAYCYFQLGVLLTIPDEMRREEQGIFNVYQRNALDKNKPHPA